MVAEKAYSAATSISLDAIEFEAGESSLRKETEPYLVKIGELMNKRPGLRIRLCGVAAPNDISAFKQKEALALKEKAGKEHESNVKTIDTTSKTYKEEMLALAKERALVIKAKLVSSYKIDAKRLFDCLPSITSKDERPRVDVLI
jgi:outer membrane protein OmpA-like peptidoglycan-associated protein